MNLLMRVKEDRENVSLKLSIKKTKIMASSSITSWQREEEKVETVTDFLFWDSKITADGDCSHEIIRWFFLGRDAMTKKKKKCKDSTLLTKIHIVKAMVFPELMDGC